MFAGETKGIRWGIERRLEFIEFRLFWEGGVNRSDIVEEFGVSVPQASKDLASTRSKRPKTSSTTAARSGISRHEVFRPKFIQLDAAAYLERLTVAGHRHDGGADGLGIEHSQRRTDYPFLSDTSRPTFFGHCWHARAETAQLRFFINP